MPTRITSTIDKAITDWVNAELFSYGANAVWNAQTAEGDFVGTRLPLPFVRLTVLQQGKKQGSSTYKPGQNQGEFVYEWERQFTLQVEVFAKDKHLEMASVLQDSLDLPIASRILRDAGLTMYRYTPALDTSAVLNGTYELRAQFDIFFSYISERTESPSEINTVNIDGTLGGHEINITVDKENA